MNKWTLNNVVESLNRVANNRQDIIVEPFQLFYEDYYDLLNGHKLSNLAQKQLCVWLDIPSSAHFKFKNNVDISDSWGNIINYQIHNTDNSKHRMMRVVDNTIMGFVSDKFAVQYDAHRTFPAIIQNILDAGLEIESLNISETKTYLKAVSPRIDKQLQSLGESVQIGTMLHTSDYGVSMHWSSLFTNDLTCLNGAVVSKTFFSLSQRHLGPKLNSLENGFVDYSEVDTNVDEVIEKMSKGIVELLSEENMYKVSSALINAKSKSTELKDIENIKKYLKRFGITKHEFPKIEEYYNGHNDKTVYGLSSAVTRYAQDKKNYDDRVRLETIGWDIIEDNYSPKERFTD